MLAAVLQFHVEQARLAEQAVGIAHVIDRRDDILAGDQPERLAVGVSTGETSDEPADLFVEFGDRFVCRGTIGAVLLRRVVEVRQIDIEEVGAEPLRSEDGRRDDPLGAFDVRERPPKVLQRKVPELLQQLGIQRLGLGVAPERFAAVGVVDTAQACRSRRPRPQCCAAETRPPR